MIRVIGLLLLLSFNLLHGFDPLVEYKLKVINNYKPAANWTLLKFDDSFTMQFEHPDSFIRMGTCLHVSDGKFYIVDNNQHKVVVFDEKGCFKQKLGQVGKGPGDLYFPGWLVYNEEGFLVDDNNGIEIFKKDLSFKDRIRPFLAIYRFDLYKSYIYCNIVGSYRGRHPLVLKLDMTGKVLNGFYDEVVENSYLKQDPAGTILNIKGNVVFIPDSWNTIYILDKDIKLKKKIKVKYELLDKVGDCNNKMDVDSLWFCRLFQSARVYRDKIYILLDLPRLEILQVDLEGNILEHFYNDSDFRFMRWCGFAVDTIDERTVFYVMGYSIGKEKGRDLSEWGVYRMTITGKKDSLKK